MPGVFEYYNRFQTFRGRVTGLPVWARYIVFLAALPGILLLALSILAVLVSILALLLLAVPAYRLLSALLVDGQNEATERVEGVIVDDDPNSPGRKRVDATVIE
jgi:hypothetical protein